MRGRSESIAGRWSARFAAIRVVACLIALVSWEPGAAVAADTSAPKHIGVEGCGSSTCHGAGNQWIFSDVAQDEFAIWTSRDNHSRAFTALAGDRGRAIATRLGIADATTSDQCVDCHTDNVPTASRGPKFSAASGVGCEACHGGAERWLASHSADNSKHADNLAKGMTRLEDAGTRAEVCMRCHIGTADRSVSHDLYAAGHPRLRFELVTYAAIQPAHVRYDGDYVRRKAAHSTVKDWIVGEASGASRDARLLADAGAHRTGPFLAFERAECFACHQYVQANSRPLRRLDQPATQDTAEMPVTEPAPGAVHARTINPDLSRLVVLLAIAEAVSPQAEPDLATAISGLRGAASADGPALSASASKVRVLTDGLEAALAAKTYSPTQTLDVLDRLVALGRSQDGGSYAVAERVVMGAAVLVRDVGDRLPATADERAATDAALHALYAAVQSPETYEASDLAKGLSDLAIVAGQMRKRPA